MLGSFLSVWGVDVHRPNDAEHFELVRHFISPCK
jgi:hypothetical protein